MSTRKITAYNLGRDNWEDVIRYGVDTAVDVILSRSLVPGNVLDAIDSLGPTVFKDWVFRGAQAAATGDGR